ncbi:hypothetical protein BH20ACT2_BH20ACT2_17980 [soil metagenome]
MVTPAPRHGEAVWSGEPGIPIECSLDAGSLGDRLTEWRVILDRARSRARTDDGAWRVEFDDRIDIGELARLVAAEQACCAFFSFAITLDARGLALEVRAPADAEDLVTSLFGSPA